VSPPGAFGALYSPQASGSSTTGVARWSAARGPGGGHLPSDRAVNAVVTSVRYGRVGRGINPDDHLCETHR
jgi:hypothetical protein